MITIGKPYINKMAEGYSRLICDILVDGERRTVWLECAEEYEPYLCTERCDAYVIGLLKWCMERGHDIHSEVPVTDELYYNLTTQLIPSLAKYSEGMQEIRIDAPLLPPIEEGEAVGTGCSCGIDSFYAILNHLNTPNTRFNLTHVCINSTGSFKCSVDPEQMQIERFGKTAEVAKRLNLKLVATTSNFSDLFVKRNLYVHSFSNTFAVYALQKLWRVYYYGSSGLDFSYFSIRNVKNSDAAYYELLSLQCFSTSRLRIYSDGGERMRAEKLASIADAPIVQEYLHVCTEKPYNCGDCMKCRRTLLMLDASGKLESYRKVFDIDYYKAHRNHYYDIMYAIHWAGEEESDIQDSTFQALCQRKEFRARKWPAYLRMVARKHYRRLRKALKKK